MTETELRETIFELERIRRRTAQLLASIENTEQPEAVAVLQHEHNALCRKRAYLLVEAAKK